MGSTHTHTHTRSRAQGGLLLATPNAHEVLGNDRLEQARRSGGLEQARRGDDAVCGVARGIPAHLLSCAMKRLAGSHLHREPQPHPGQHGPAAQPADAPDLRPPALPRRGASHTGRGVQAPATRDDFWRRKRCPPSQNAPASMASAFADARVFCGGWTGQQVVHIMHGHSLPKAVQVRWVVGGGRGGRHAKGLAWGRRPPTRCSPHRCDPADRSWHLVGRRGGGGQPGGGGQAQPRHLPVFFGVSYLLLAPGALMGLRAHCTSSASPARWHACRAVVWEPGQLQRELEAGVWCVAT